jgi:hypothetical protein
MPDKPYPSLTGKFQAAVSTCRPRPLAADGAGGRATVSACGAGAGARSAARSDRDGAARGPTGLITSGKGYSVAI